MLSRVILSAAIALVSTGHVAAFSPTVAPLRAAVVSSAQEISGICSLVASSLMSGSSSAASFASKRGVVLGLRMSGKDSGKAADKGGILASDGDVVGVTYKGSLDDGEVFDQNLGGPLLEFEVGSGRVIKGFDLAVRGLAVGESRKVRCEPKDAYGEYDDDNVASVPIESMPEPPKGLKMEPGMVMQLTTGQIAVISEVTDTTVTLDGNHPLAGKTLNFEDRETALKMKVKELEEILNNPLLVMVASEVLQNPVYIQQLKTDLAASEDKGKFINTVLASPEWMSVNEALMQNPELLKLVRDPEALKKMADSMPDKAPAKEEGLSNVVEAEFSKDA